MLILEMGLTWWKDGLSRIFYAFESVSNMYQTGYAIIILAVLFCFIGIAQYNSNEGMIEDLRTY